MAQDLICMIRQIMSGNVKKKNTGKNPSSRFDSTITVHETVACLFLIKLVAADNKLQRNRQCSPYASFSSFCGLIRCIVLRKSRIFCLGTPLLFFLSGDGVLSAEDGGLTLGDRSAGKWAYCVIRAPA